MYAQALTRGNRWPEEGAICKAPWRASTTPKTMRNSSARKPAPNLDLAWTCLKNQREIWSSRPLSGAGVCLSHLSRKRLRRVLWGMQSRGIPPLSTRLLPSPLAPSTLMTLTQRPIYRRIFSRSLRSSCSSRLRAKWPSEKTRWRKSKRKSLQCRLNGSHYSQRNRHRLSRLPTEWCRWLRSKLTSSSSKWGRSRASLWAVVWLSTAMLRRVQVQPTKQWSRPTEDSTRINPIKISILTIIQHLSVLHIKLQLTTIIDTVEIKTETSQVQRVQQHQSRCHHRHLASLPPARKTVHPTTTSPSLPLMSLTSSWATSKTWVSQ